MLVVAVMGTSAAAVVAAACLVLLCPLLPVPGVVWMAEVGTVPSHCSLRGPHLPDQ